MIEGYHYQNAYVTRNIAKAIEQFRTRANVTDVMTYEGATEVWTPNGRGPQVSKLAFIWIDNLQYELIEPISAPSGIYSDALPAGDEMKFHHVAMRVDDWDSFRAKVDKQKYPVVLEGDTGGLKFVYLDARDFVGHYLEYVWTTPERWAQMGMKA